MTEIDAPWEPSPAYTELHALACSMRPDWDPTELHDAMTAVHQAGWGWKDVFREVSRLIWAQDETPVTLRNSGRVPSAPVATGPEVNAKGRALVMAAIEEKLRATGPQRVLQDEKPQDAA